MKHEAIYIVSYASSRLGCRRTYAFTPFDDSMLSSVKQLLADETVDPDSIEIEVYEPARVLKAQDLLGVGAGVLVG